MPEGNNNFEILRASAGSGKTFRLVLTYLECALRYDDPRYFRRILALTFTNKAAHEMKSRVLEDLKKLVDCNSDKLDRLVERLNESPEEIRRRASLVQQAMLHNYSEISIMTIDKFINRLVKSFARDLAIEQDYRVELDSNSVVTDAVSRLLNKVGERENAQLTELLKRYTKQQVFEDKNAAVRDPLFSLGKNLMKESMKGVVNSLSEVSPEEFHEIGKSLTKEINASKDRLTLACENALSAIKKTGIPEEHFGSNGGIIPLIENMKKGVPKETGNKGLIQKLSDSRLMVLSKHQKDWESTLSEASFSSKMIEVRDAMLAMGQDYNEEVTQEAQEFKLKNSLRKRVGLLGTLSGLVKEVDQVQMDNNIRTFDAMHESIAEIVRNNPAPFIYERLGERYNHIFIDEFQDTSVTQWLNLLVLYDYAMSKNGKTLVVGDGKQAIYRFRNGDYKQLMDLPKVKVDNVGLSIEEAKRTLGREAFEDNLDDNWRTGKDIVEWNNRLFSELKKYIPEDLQKVYDGHQQNPRMDFDGSVYVDTFLGANKTIRTENYCDKVVERVKHYTNSGFDPGDITVLVSQNIEGSLISQSLLKAGFNPVTEESLQLGRHPGPLTVIAILKWIMRPKDYRQSAAIVQCLSALRSDTEHPIDESKVLEKCVYNKKFDTHAMLEELVPGLEIKSYATTPLVPLVGRICSSLGITENYPAYAEGMLELAREVGGSDDGGITALLNLWEKTGRNKSIITAKTRDSVQIMTVHKAKGLAFKIVIFMLDHKKFSDNTNHIPVSLGDQSIGDLTDVIFEPNDFKNTTVEGQKDAEMGRIMLDDINKVYVAMTRPEERLDLLVGLLKEEVKKDKISSVSEILYHSVCDLNEGVFETGWQTDGKNAELPRQTEQQKEISYTQPRGIVTGEDISQIVSKPPAESLSTSPGKLNPRELGSAVHGVLERISSIEDWPRVKLALMHSQAYDPNDRDIIIERVQTILDSEDLQPHFETSAHIETERTFIDSNGKTARPDRLTNTATQGWTVIDYKTTKHQHDKHVQQVLRYVKLISQIENSVTKGIIVYTDPFEIVKLN